MCSPASRKKTEELNRQILPPDVKVRPFYDRSDLVRVTTDTVEGNLLRGMILVLVVLIFFLVSFRAARKKSGQQARGSCPGEGCPDFFLGELPRRNHHGAHDSFSSDRK